MSTTKDVFDLAVQNEIDAALLYSKMSKKTKDTTSKIMLEELAKEELQHKVVLEKLFATVNDFDTNFVSNEKEVDIKLSDYLAEVELKENSTMQETLIYAMQAEKIAYELYISLGNLSSNEKVKKILIGLADIEMGHKNKLEKLYDDRIYMEN